MTLPVEKRTRRRLALLFSVPLAFSLLFFLIDMMSERTDTRLLQTHMLHSSISQLWSLAQDAESAERGFLLTGDEHDLTPLEAGDAILDVQIHTCMREAEGDNKLAPKVARIAQLVHERFLEADSVVKTKRAQGTEPAVNVIRTRTGERTMNQLHKATIDLLYTLDLEERTYLEHEHRINEASFGFFLAGTLITILVLAWLYRTLIS